MRDQTTHDLRHSWVPLSFPFTAAAPCDASLKPRIEPMSAIKTFLSPIVDLIGRVAAVSPIGKVWSGSPAPIQQLLRVASLRKNPRQFYLFFAIPRKSRVSRVRKGFNRGKGMHRKSRALGLLSQRIGAGAGLQNELTNPARELFAEARYPSQAGTITLALATSSMQNWTFMSGRRHLEVSPGMLSLETFVKRRKLFR